MLRMLKKYYISFLVKFLIKYFQSLTLQHIFEIFNVVLSGTSYVISTDSDEESNSETI